MNRPSPISFVIGNPVCGLVLVAGSALVIWQWWLGLAPPLAAIIAAATISSAVQASGRVSRYRAWKRQWDAMAGEARPLPLAKRLAKIPGFRPILAIVIWFAFASLVATHPQDGTIALASLPYLIVMPCVLAGWGLYRLFRRGSRPKPARELAPVALLLPRPGRSPTRQEATRALPDFCKTLIRQ